jgi:hypothetical protein
MKDDEFPRLARIFNFHGKYRDILTEGMVLPPEYGPYAVSRGNNITRIITLRNLSWENKSYIIRPGQEIGLDDTYQYYARQFHPVEKVLGIYPKGETINVIVPPFRSYLLIVSTEKFDEPGIIGSDYNIIKNIDGQDIEIDILGMPGSSSYIQLEESDNYSRAALDGEESSTLNKGRVVKISFPGQELTKPVNRHIAIMDTTAIPNDTEALYEATVFAADNNALEVRSLYRSGPTEIKEVKDARDAFFNQTTFTRRGIWDRNLFDGDPETSFFPSRKYKKDKRVDGGCFRLDLGQVISVDSIILITPDEYSLQPLLKDEGNYVEISADLVSWKTLTYLAGEKMNITIGEPVRYLRFKEYADRLAEIVVYRDGKAMDSELFRASNLFAHPDRKEATGAWHTSFTLDEIAEGSYLSVAINGFHGVEGAYAALRVDGKYVGAPDRSRSYPSNTWEYINAAGDSNYTYYFPVDNNYRGKKIEVYVIVFDKEAGDLTPEVWLSANPFPYKKIRLTLTKKSD